MSFKVIKFGGRLVGGPARYRVSRNGKSVALLLREDVATAAGISPDDWVMTLIGSGDHAGMIALRSCDEKKPPKEARRVRVAGSTRMIEIPYAQELKKVLPAPPKDGVQTLPLTVEDTDRSGAISLSRRGVSVGFEVDRSTAKS